jgi:protein TonB
MIRKLVLIQLLLAICLTAFSQQLAIESFEPNITDQTARYGDDARKDQNDKQCAIVKINTSLKSNDLDCNVGTAGVHNTEQKAGEVWVWLSAGTTKIKIGSTALNATTGWYPFPAPLSESTVYEMKLKSGTVTTIVEDAIMQQFLVASCLIAGATIDIDGYGREAFEKDGSFQKQLPFGKYRYQVGAPKYQSSAGVFEITAKGKTILSVELQPNYSKVSITADGNIYINEELKGPNSWSGELVKGNYKLEVKKPSHRTAVKLFEVEANKDLTLQAPAPTPMYGKLQITSNKTSADIYIDGERVNETTPAILDKILVGQHTIKVKADGYTEASSTVLVEEGKIAAVKVDLTEQPAIFDHVETPPAFPGGERELMKWLSENITYPVIAAERGTQGRVILRFVVSPDGSVGQVEVVRGVEVNLDEKAIEEVKRGLELKERSSEKVISEEEIKQALELEKRNREAEAESLNNESIRVVKNMPRWFPGTQNGNPVYVYYTLPILFKLQN